MSSSQSPDADPDLDIRVVEPFTRRLPPELDGRPNVRMQSGFRGDR